MAGDKDKLPQSHTCPFCDEEIAEAAFPYCEACGVKVLRCPKCGLTVPREQEKCPHCGANIKEEAAKSPMAKKVSESFQKFQKGVGTWGSVSEKEYYNIIQPNYPLKG